MVPNPPDLNLLDYHIWLQASCLRRINGPKPARFEPTGLSYLVASELSEKNKMVPNPPDLNLLDYHIWLQANCLRRINGPKPARFEPTGLSYLVASELSEKNKWSQTRQIWTYWTIIWLQANCPHELRPKLKTTDELKVVLQIIWKELPQEHINKALAKLTKCLTAYMGAAAIGGHFEHLQSPSLHSHLIINKRALFTATNRQLVKTIFKTRSTA